MLRPYSIYRRSVSNLGIDSETSTVSKQSVIMRKETESEFPPKRLSDGKSPSERYLASLSNGEMQIKIHGEISTQLSECMKWKTGMQPNAFWNVGKSDHLQDSEGGNLHRHLFYTLAGSLKGFT